MATPAGVSTSQGVRFGLTFADERAEPAADAPGPDRAVGGRAAGRLRQRRRDVGQRAQERWYECGGGRHGCACRVLRGHRGTCAYRHLSAWMALRPVPPRSRPAGSAASSRCRWSTAAPRPSTWRCGAVRPASPLPSDRCSSISGSGDPSADSAVPIVAALPPDVRDRFEVVLMDPRATLHSSATACPNAKPGIEGAYYSLPDPNDAAAVQAFMDRMAAANGACLAELGTDPAPYGTWSATADMDAIRASLGAERISYLGYSTARVWARSTPCATAIACAPWCSIPLSTPAAAWRSSAPARPGQWTRSSAGGRSSAMRRPPVRRWPPGRARDGGGRHCRPALTDASSGLSWTRGDFEQFLDAAVSGLDPAKWTALGPALAAFAAGDTGPFYAGVRSAAAWRRQRRGAAPRPAAPRRHQDALVTVNCADLADRPDAAAVSSILTAGPAPLVCRPPTPAPTWQRPAWLAARQQAHHRHQRHADRPGGGRDVSGRPAGGRGLGSSHGQGSRA